MTLTYCGMGPKPLVALHGFMGRGADWAELANFLPTFTLLAPDLPGHGAAAHAPSCRMEDAAQAVLDALAEGPFVPPFPLYGYSMGARLALYLALRTPELWSALVLESGSPGLHTEAERHARQQVDAQRAAALDADPAAFVRAWSNLPLFATQTPEQRVRRERVRLEEAPAGWAQSLREMGTGTQPNLWPLLPTLTVPTLLLTGTHDAKFEAIAHEMHAHIPHARWVSLPAGHAPHVEIPLEVAQTLTEFWASNGV